MKITVKKLKVMEEMSDETLCFHADLYIDGQKAGSVANDGQGGAHRYSLPHIEQQINAYCKTLPKFKDDYCNMELAWDADTLIADVVLQEVDKKKLKTLLKNNMVFVEDEKLMLIKLKPEIAKNPPADLYSQLALKFNVDITKILNTLNFEHALELYRRYV